MSISFLAMLFLVLFFSIIIGIIFGVRVQGKIYFLPHHFPKLLQWCYSVKVALGLLGGFLVIALAAVIGYYTLPIAPTTGLDDQVVLYSPEQIIAQDQQFRQVLIHNDASLYTGAIVTKTQQFPFAGDKLDIDLPNYYVLEKEQNDQLIEVQQYYAGAYIDAYDITNWLEKGELLDIFLTDNQSLSYMRDAQDNDRPALAAFTAPVFLSAWQESHATPEAYASHRLSAGQYGVVISVPKGTLY